MFGLRRKVKDKYGNDENFADKQNQLDLEKGDVTAMIIAAFITIILPVILILCVIYAVVWFIFLR